MNEIRFKVHRIWKDEEQIALRVAQVIGYSPHCPPHKKDSGYRWQLNDSNDWWMDRDPKTEEYIIAARYSSTVPMEALKTVLEWILILHCIFGRVSFVVFWPAVPCNLCIAMILVPRILRWDTPLLKLP